MNAGLLSTRSWTLQVLVGFLLAAILHITLFGLVHHKESNLAGSANDIGSTGLEIGLGQMGSYANATKRLQKIETTKQLQKKISQIIPKVITPPTIEAKQVYQQTSTKEQPVAPKEIPPETPLKETEEREKMLPQPQPEQAASDAMVKASGQSEQQTSGGKKGNAKSYIQTLYQWLARHRTYPPAAKKDKQQGTVMLAFTMNRQGNILNSRIQTSSGNSLLDDAALNMLSKAAPLPPVPDDFFPRRETLPLVMPIEFSLITNSSFGE